MNVNGVWRIVEMDLWDAEAIDLLGPGYIQFSADQTGHFRFIAVEGWMDCHSDQRDGRPCVEFTWEGNDESDPASGRGWAALDEDGSLRGHIYFHRIALAGRVIGAGRVVSDEMSWARCSNRWGVARRCRARRGGGHAPGRRRQRCPQATCSWSDRPRRGG